MSSIIFKLRTNVLVVTLVNIKILHLKCIYLYITFAILPYNWCTNKYTIATFPIISVWKHLKVIFIYNIMFKNYLTLYLYWQFVNSFYKVYELQKLLFLMGICKYKYNYYICTNFKKNCIPKILQKYLTI